MVQSPNGIVTSPLQNIICKRGDGPGWEVPDSYGYQAKHKVTKHSRCGVVSNLEPPNPWKSFVSSWCSPVELAYFMRVKKLQKSVTTFPGSARSVKLQIPSIPRNHTMWTCRGSQGRRDQGWWGWNWWLCESTPSGAFGSFCRADFEGTWVIQLQKMQRNQENGAKIDSPYLVAGGVVITVYSLQWPW